MARTINNIQGEILANIAANPNLQELNSTSNVAIYRLLTYIVAVAIWTLEKIFDVHKAQIDKALYEQKSGTLRWYRNKALDFQYGFDLLEDSDKYDTEGYTDAQIAVSKIVKYCSVKETQESGKVFIKIASQDGENLAPITEAQKAAFVAYFQKIKYAGVRIQIVNNPADILGLQMTVYRNPLVLDTSGNSIVDGGNPIETAIKAYLQNLPFDGEFLINDFIEYLRNVDGVNNVNITSITSSWYDVASANYTPPLQIQVGIIPTSGYFTINDFDAIMYVV